MREDLLFANAVVKAKEEGLFSSERLNRMLDCTRVEDAVRILVEAGYGGGMILDDPYRFEKILKAEAVNGTGSILFDISKLDFRKYPIMRWKWKVDVLPSGADGRSEAKDDQAIGIYVGAGRWSTTSVAWRWETETPKKAEGEASYGLGMVSVKWYCVRNREDKTGVWYVDECNIYEALDKRFKGKIPTKNVALSISCNSQYTKSKAVAYLEYVEFLPAQAAKKSSK